MARQTLPAAEPVLRMGRIVERIVDFPFWMGRYGQESHRRAALVPSGVLLVGISHPQHHGLFEATARDLRGQEQAAGLTEEPSRL